MNTPSTAAIADRLQALARTASSPGVRRQALRLRGRLLSPVRVVLLGLPGSVRLDLVAALAGDGPLPPAAGVVTFEMRYDTADEAEITLSDGSVRVVAGRIADCDLSGAALVVFKAPLPNLRRMSLLTVVADSSPREQRAAIAWASRRSDIALWCTPDFARDDLAVWEHVPDEVKDHAFLVLTGASPAAAEALRDRYRHEFLDVFAASGGRGDVAILTERIASHAAEGQRIDAENALLFLRSQETPPRPGTRPSAAEAETAATPAAGVVLSMAASPGDGPGAERPPLRRANVSRPVVSTGFSYLRKCGDTLLRDVRRGAASEEVLARCVETLAQLSVMLAYDDDSAAQPDVARLADTIMEAEAMVVLLGSEGGEEAVLDAVSLLLQVRQDFEACIAA